MNSTAAKRLGVSAFCVVALAMLAYLTWNTIMSRGSSEGLLRGVSNATIDPYLNGRPDFRICVDRVGAKGLLATNADATVAKLALNEAFSTVPSIPTQYRAQIFELGCPRAEVLSKGPMSYRERNGARDGVRIIGKAPDAPSPYRVFVYFTDSAKYAETFGTEVYASTTEEDGCQGDFCFPVTRAVYVPLGSSTGPLRDGFLETLNLLNEQQARDLLQGEMYPQHTPTAPPPSR